MGPPVGTIICSGQVIAIRVDDQRWLVEQDVDNIQPGWVMWAELSENLKSKVGEKLSQSGRKVVTKCLARFAQVYVTLLPKPLGGKPLFRPPDRSSSVNQIFLYFLEGNFVAQFRELLRDLFGPTKNAQAFRGKYRILFREKILAAKTF